MFFFGVSRVYDWQSAGRQVEALGGAGRLRHGGLQSAVSAEVEDPETGGWLGGASGIPICL